MDAELPDKPEGPITNVQVKLANWCPRGGSEPYLVGGSHVHEHASTVWSPLWGHRRRELLGSTRSKQVLHLAGIYAYLHDCACPWARSHPSGTAIDRPSGDTLKTENLPFTIVRSAPDAKSRSTR